MYHLIVSFGENSWKKSPASISKSRFLEYTDNETTSRFSNLTTERLDELTEFPALFMCEDEVSPTFIGKITRVRKRSDELLIDFEKIAGVPDLDEGAIPSISKSLDIHNFEFSRTHWAIKEEDLYRELISNDILNKDQILPNESLGASVQEHQNVLPATNKMFNDQQIFIVHGHDDFAKNDVRKFVTDIGKEPIILHMQASGGMTIIEKIDHYSNVGFAIVLYTECDVGTKRDSLVFKRRARKNVVFEHGYLIGKIGRPRVVALVKGDVETPNDISGVVYIEMNDESWKEQLSNELKSCGYL